MGTHAGVKLSVPGGAEWTARHERGRPLLTGTRRVLRETSLPPDVRAAGSVEARWRDGCGSGCDSSFGRRCTASSQHSTSVRSAAPAIGTGGSPGGGAVTARTCRRTGEALPGVCRKQFLGLAVRISVGVFRRSGSEFSIDQTSRLSGRSRRFPETPAVDHLTVFCRVAGKGPSTDTKFTFVHQVRPRETRPGRSVPRSCAEGCATTVVPKRGR